MGIIAPVEYSPEDRASAKQTIARLARNEIRFDSWSRVGTSLSFLIASTDIGGVNGFIDLTDLHHNLRSAKYMPLYLDTSIQLFSKHVMLWAAATHSVPWCNAKGRLMKIQGLKYRDPRLTQSEMLNFCEGLAFAATDRD